MKKIIYLKICYIKFRIAVYFKAIWYILWYSRFGMLHQEKSGNPDKFCISIAKN
jgi:hypothetical protein